MSWNYRVFHRSVHDSIDTYEDEFTVREAYYDDEGNVNAWSEPIAPHGGTFAELVSDLSMMLAGIHRLAVVELSEDQESLVAAPTNGENQ